MSVIIFNNNIYKEQKSWMTVKADQLTLQLKCTFSSCEERDDPWRGWGSTEEASVETWGVWHSACHRFTFLGWTEQKCFSQQREKFSGPLLPPKCWSRCEGSSATHPLWSAYQVKGEVQALAQLGNGGEQQSSSSLGDGSFLRLRTERLQYISVRLDCPLGHGWIRNAVYHQGGSISAGGSFGEWWKIRWEEALVCIPW